MLYYVKSQGPKLVHEPIILLEARERVASTRQLLEKYEAGFHDAERVSKEAWAYYHKICRVNNRKIAALQAHERKFSKKARSERERSKRAGLGKNRAFSFNREQISYTLSDKAAELSRQRVQLVRQSEAAYYMAIDKEEALKAATSLMDDAYDQLESAEYVLKHFQVYPWALRRLAMETDEHFRVRIEYLEKRRMVFIEQIDIPAEYREEVEVRELDNGDVDFFFGSSGTVGLQDHAHYVLYASGAPPYRRPPGRGRLF